MPNNQVFVRSRRAARTACIYVSGVLTLQNAVGCRKTSPSPDTSAALPTQSTRAEGPKTSQIAHESLENAHGATTVADDDALAAQLVALKELLPADAESPVSDEAFQRLDRELRKIVELASLSALKANASMALGLVYEAKGDDLSAASFYRQAAAWMPQEPGPHAVLALTLAKLGDYPAAIASQERLIRLDPDDLQAWLILGELNLKGKRSEDAAMAYKAYEARRKGLLDGLTLKEQGRYKLAEEERVRCAQALGAARDNGTALGLLYAVKSDPSARVRAALADVFAEQRFVGYLATLEKMLAQESDPDAKEAMTYAIAEIKRAPVETAPDPAQSPDIADTTATGESQAVEPESAASSETTH